MIRGAIAAGLAIAFLAGLIPRDCAARELPRILVRDGRFATVDGKPFVPLGVNWVIVSPGVFDWCGKP
jgi:hypothetical protein